MQEGLRRIGGSGHSPEVTKVYGLAPLPDVTSGRKEVRRLTGKSEVPVLVFDHGELIVGSWSIGAQHPANG